MLAETGDHGRARERGKLADARQAKDAQPLARVVVGGQQLDGQRRQVACLGRGIANGNCLQPSAAHDRGHLRAETRVADADARRARQQLLDGVGQARREGGLITPQPVQALDAEQDLAERPCRGVSIRLQGGREACQRIERRLHARSVQVAIGGQELGFGHQAVGRAQRLIA